MTWHIVEGGRILVAGADESAQRAGNGQSLVHAPCLVGASRPLRCSPAQMHVAPSPGIDSQCLRWYVFSLGVLFADRGELWLWGRVLSRCRASVAHRPFRDDYSSGTFIYPRVGTRSLMPDCQVVSLCCSSRGPLFVASDGTLYHITVADPLSLRQHTGRSRTSSRACSPSRSAAAAAGWPGAVSLDRSSGIAARRQFSGAVDASRCEPMATDDVHIGLQAAPLLADRALLHVASSVAGAVVVLGGQAGQTAVRSPY